MLQQTNIDTLFLFVSDMFARKRFKHMRNKKCNRLAFHSYPAAQELEHRELLAVAWIGQGPSPIEYGQVEGLTSQNNPVAGAIQAVVTHPTNPDVMWVGSVNGGVWGTTNATSLSPAWTPLTNGLPNESIGAMVLDPSDNSGQTLLAGYGAKSSFYGNSGVLGGLIRTDNAGLSWTQLGTTFFNGQSITGIAANGNTIVAGSSPFYSNAGISQSTNGGLNWTRLSGVGTLPNAGAFDLQSDPTNPSRIYAGTTSGIYRSNDNGSTWVNVTPSGSLISSSTTNIKISVSKNTGAIFVGVINNGRLATLFRSLNQGSAWKFMDIPEVVETTVNTVMDATNAGPIVITSAVNHNQKTGDRVKVSNVLGNTAANGVWTITVLSATTFSLDNSSGNAAYAGGGTWQSVQGLQPSTHPGYQGEIHFSILADATNSNIVYVGGDRQPLNNGSRTGGWPNAIGAINYTGRLFRGNAASPSGAQWTPITHDFADADGSGPAQGTAPHADSRNMTFDALGNIIEVDDGGIYKRSKPTLNTGVWSSLVGNIQITEVDPGGLSYDPLNNILVAGAQDVGSSQQMSTGGAVWQQLNQGDGAATAAADLGNGQSVRYSSAQYLGGFTRRTYNSSNSLLSASYVGLNVSGYGYLLSVDPTVGFVTPFELNSLNPNQMVIGTRYIFESSDGGDNLNLLADVGGTRSIAYGGPGDPSLLWVGGSTSSSILMERDSSTGILQKVGAYPGNYSIDIAVGSLSASTAYVVDTSGSVYWTTDTGASWSTLTGNLSGLDPVLKQITVATIGTGNASRDLVIVGGIRGVYAMDSNKPGIWIKLGTGLPSTIVHDIRYSAADDFLYVGTAGRGAWTTSDFVSSFMSDQVGPDAVFTSPVVPNQSLAAVSSVQLVFSEPVNGVDLSDLTISRDGLPVSLDPAKQSISTTDYKTWLIHGLTPITTVSGNFVITLMSGGSGIADGNGNPIKANAQLSFNVKTISGSVYDVDTNAGIGRVRVYNDTNLNGSFDGVSITKQSVTTNVRVIDMKTISKSVLITGASMPVNGMTVTVNLPHTHVGDLIVTLISPLGTRVRLLNRQGGNGQNLVGVVFDDSGMTRLPSSIKNYSGLIMPYDSLSRFNGETGNGIWTLEVVDNAYGDVGMLKSFSLNVTSSSEQNVFTNAVGDFRFMNTPAAKWVLKTDLSKNPTWKVGVPSIGQIETNQIPGGSIEGLKFGIKRPAWVGASSMGRSLGGLKPAMIATPIPELSKVSVPKSKKLKLNH